MDARNMCILRGFSEETVNNSSIEEFEELYHSLMRIKARDEIDLLLLVQHAYHADKKGLTKFMKSLSKWLPRIERNGPKGDAKAFEKALKRK